MKTRKRIVRELQFRSGAGIHGKSEKAKRRAAKVVTRNEY
jgi:hypothetical protein